MYKILSLIAGVCLVVACSHASQESSAQKRAERLNAGKAEARALVDAGHYDDAIAVLEPLAAEASGDHQLFVMLGDSYQAVDRYDDAVSSYETAIRLAYQDSYPHMKLANLLMEKGKTGRALTEYELAARFGEIDAVTRYNYGLALHQMGRKSQALKEWRAAYQLESGNPLYVEAVGIGLTDTNPREAVTYFETAAELGADGAAFHNNYGLALQRVGDRRRAAAEFARAAELAPDNEPYRFKLAAAYMNMGAYREAMAEWDSLIAAFGPRWSYTVHRGRALLESGRYAEAIEAVGEILAEFESGALQKDKNRFDRTPPFEADALEILAMSYRGADDAARSLEFIRRAVDLAPTNVTYLNNYGVILAEGGSIDEAIIQWKRVLEIDADNAAARKNLSAMEP